LEKPQIKHLLLDVLKPHQPSILEFASVLREIEGVKKVDITVVEIDSETKSLRILINGDCLNYKDIRSNIYKQSAIIKSVDQVIVQ
jgi:hypothetical protein